MASLHYELVMVLGPELAEEAVNSAVEKVTQFVAAKGGTMTQVEHWGLRRLAYPIKRYSDGNYVLSRFQLEPKGAADLEATLRHTEEVIRHLLVRIDKPVIAEQQAAPEERPESQAQGEEISHGGPE